MEMVTVKVVSVLVFWILIGWTTGGIRRRALNNRSPFFNNNTINGSPSKYLSEGGRAPDYFAFSNQNGTSASNNIGVGSLGSIINNTIENTGSGSSGKDIAGNSGVTNSSFSINALGNTLTGTPEDSRPKISQSIIQVPPNNDSSGHPYFNRPQFAISSPLNLTNNIVSVNTTTVYPFQPNGFGNYSTTARPVNNGGNPSGNFFQQIGDGFKFVQDVAQNISTSANNTFTQWLQGLSNPTQNGNSQSNTSQNGGFSYELHWPGGNWSFEIPGNNISKLTVGGSLNGIGFFEAQAKNNTSRGHAAKKIDNSETGMKENEHHGVHSNTKNHSGKKKVNKKKQHRAYEEEEHKALYKAGNL